MHFSIDTELQNKVGFPDDTRKLLVYSTWLYCVHPLFLVLDPNSNVTLTVFPLRGIKFNCGGRGEIFSRNGSKEYFNTAMNKTGTSLCPAPKVDLDTWSQLADGVLLTTPMSSKV